VKPCAILPYTGKVSFLKLSFQQISLFACIKKQQKNGLFAVKKALKY
jgi:hypothetical protein